MYGDTAPKTHSVKKKKQEIQGTWSEKTSSINADKDSNKLWQLVRNIDDETATKHNTTVLEENNINYTGNKSANILAEFYKEERTPTLSSILTLPSTVIP